MVLGTLKNSLKDTITKIAKTVFVDEKLINELVKDIQRALLQADVNVKLVFELTNTIKSRIKKEETPPGLTKKEHLINIVYEELVEFLGGEHEGLAVDSKQPFIIMLVGLFGSGKTTTTGKLARYYTKRGKTVAVVGLDTWRPAAMEQLEKVGSEAGAKVFVNRDYKDKDLSPVDIYEEFEEKLQDFDIVLVDTAGRDALNDELIAEIESITSAIEPDETLLVLSADIGQTAKTQAEQFHKSCGVTGVITTKVDGTAKAGGALSACAVTRAPIKFLGVGEKLDDLESFKPKGFVGRLLGMGDIEGLLEKAKLAIDKEDAKDIQKKFLKGKFNLLDLYEQMNTLSKMGSLSKILDMIPGMSQLKIPKNALQGQDGKMKRWRTIMDSCTKEELENPGIIKSSRVERIAKGAGVTTKEVKDLLKQHKQAKKLTKMLQGKNPKKLMKNLSGYHP